MDAEPFVPCKGTSTTTSTLISLMPSVPRLLMLSLLFSGCVFIGNDGFGGALGTEVGRPAATAAAAGLVAAGLTCVAAVMGTVADATAAFAGAAVHGSDVKL